MEFGRPSYFQGQPTTSKDDSSTSSSVALGSDEAIVGACWTGNKNLLITSSSSVRVFHVDHVQEPLRTWNFRPDQQHALTSPAVFLKPTKTRSGFHHNSSSSSSSSSSLLTHQTETPSIVSIQNRRTLISWDHDDEALTTLKSLELPISSNQLLSGFFPDVAVVIGTNGDVMCFDSQLKSLGQLSFAVNEEHTSAGPTPAKRSKSRSTSRARRRSRSNSNINDNTSTRDGPEPSLEWIVHWSKHAPIHMSKDKTVVLLYVLLRKTDDPNAAHLLVVHELTRERNKFTLQTLSQHSMNGKVKAAALGVVKKKSSDKIGNICLQMICTSMSDDDGDDDTEMDYFQVLKFPNGPRQSPSITSRQQLSKNSVEVSNSHQNNEAVDETNATKNGKGKVLSGRKRRRTGTTGEETSTTLTTTETSNKDTPYALVAISSRHTVIANVDGSSSISGGVRCVGWDSKFSVPINELFVPCHVTADAGRNVHMVLCPDGVTIALIGATTFVVYATRCAEPSLASVLGCGQTIPSNTTVEEEDYHHVSNTGSNIVSLRIENEEELMNSFSRTTGLPNATLWSLTNGSFNQKGRKENIHLMKTINMKDSKLFNQTIITYLNDSNGKSTGKSTGKSNGGAPLLSHNYIRAIVNACHQHGYESWPALKLLINTGRVSAWSCPMLVDTLLYPIQDSAAALGSSSSKNKKSTNKSQKITKQEMKRLEKDRMDLLEATLLHVQDLHEEAIVRLLRFVIGHSSKDTKYNQVNTILRYIVATPYNGSFLRSFLRSMTITETRFMLKFLHHIIKIETQKSSVEEDDGEEEEEENQKSSSQSSPKRRLDMAKAVGWTTMILDAHFQSIVMEGRHDDSKMDSVLRALSEDILELVETCKSFTMIKAQVNHLSKSKILCHAPVPIYSIEKLNAFK